MIVQTVAGGWYGRNLPGGEFACLVIDEHVATTYGNVPLPDGQNTLYLEATSLNDTFYLACVGNRDDFAWFWNGSGWRSVGVKGAGMKPVAFGPQGLYVATGPAIEVFDIPDLTHRGTLPIPTGSGGIQCVLSDGTIVTGDETYAGPTLSQWTQIGDVRVGQSYDGDKGIIEYRGKRHLLEPGECRWIKLARDGEELAITCVKQAAGMTRFFWLNTAEIAVLPLDEQPVKPKPIPVDQVEPLTGKWLVGFYEQNGNCPPHKLPPGNAQLAVRNHSGPVPRPTILTTESEGKVTGEIIGYRVGSEPQSPGEVVTIEIMEQRAHVIAAKDYRPWFYWDSPIVDNVVQHTIPRWPNLPDGSVMELNAFCGRNEPLADYEREMDRYIAEAAAKPYLIALAVQTHTTNLDLVPEPSVAIPPVIRLCKKWRTQIGDRFLGINVFNNSGRDDPNTGEGGLTANPQLLPHWQKVFSGVTGLPQVFGSGGGGGVADPTIDIISYDKKVSRRDPKGLLVRFDVSGERIVKIALSMEGDGEPPLMLEMPAETGPDGRYLRALAFKPVRTGDWFPVVDAWDLTGRQGTARGADKVKVTEDPVDPIDPPPIDPDTLVAPNQIEAVRKAMLDHPEINPLDEAKRGRIIDYACASLGGKPWGRKARNQDGTNKNTDGMTFLRSDGKFEIYDAISGHDGSATWDGFGPFKPGENGWWAPHEPV